MLKPHRVITDRINSYAAEAQAFMRRRRHHRRPYVRIQYRSGDAVDLPLESADGAAVRLAAEALIECAPTPE